MLFKSREKPDLLRRIRLWLWPRTGWDRSAKYMWRRLLRLSASPHAIALGCVAGVFTSFTPFLGFHFIIAATLAWIAGGNILASALGTWFGNPLTFPIIFMGTYNLGGIILMENTRSDINIFQVLLHGSIDAIWPLVKMLVVGGIPLGILFSMVLYFPVRAAVGAYKERRRKKLQRAAGHV